MNKIRVLFVWAGGILLPTIDAAVTEAISSFGISEVNLEGLSEYSGMQENLVLGKINDLEFCQFIIKYFDIKTTGELFRKKIMEGLKYIPGILEVISQVESKIDRWLIVDFPEEWFKQLHGSKEVFKQFPTERIIYLESSSLLRVIPDLFYYLPGKVQVSPDQCLLLDKNIKRTVHSINHGLPAAVIINPERLRREFLLRRMTAQDYRMHQRPV